VSAIVDVDPRWCFIHSTHLTPKEADGIAARDAIVGLCPTTEANLGDGFAPIDRIQARGIGVCIGSDSNVRIDPLEELRELDGIARRLTLRRDVVPLERLLAFGSTRAQPLSGSSVGNVTVDTGHPSLRGVDEADVLAALLDGCSAEVLAHET
jgi:formimidoylglutamate deiminase